ncbi:MAG: xylosidase/arabinosidase, partial [bacterium]|nr:xylosidase/arabinosidase [bacterium]
MEPRTLMISFALALGVSCLATAQERTREEVIDRLMRLYDGPSVPGVDTTTLTGKVVCGYQGWFTCPGDGAARGWFHWGGRGGFEPGACSIDIWPDMSELDDDEKHPTDFKHADGSTAHVFSSVNRKTVLRHFEWMRDYDIDAAFVQRFVGETFRPNGLNHCTTVLGHCREGANRCGRVYAVMYDLSGMRAGQVDRVMDDWRALVDRMGITRDAN